MNDGSHPRGHWSFRYTISEFGGSLGDLGTFIPLLLGMVTQCGLQLGPAMVAAGAMNIVTGFLFRIPMPVQPMKAIAAVAIADGLTEPQILTAGIITGAVVFILAVTGLVGWLNKLIPKSVVRGLQLALGLKLSMKGLQWVAGTGTLWGWDGIGVGLVCVAVALLPYFIKRVPAALVIFCLGLVCLLMEHPSTLQQTTFGMSWSMPNLLDTRDWIHGLLHGAIPQIPLTTLNSVIAVCALSKDLFPKNQAQPRRVAMSVAIMNLVSCPLGGMPMCHGAGGLAAQHRFGARTGGSVVMLGVVKIALGVALGNSLLVWLQVYPASVLGVLLLFSGFELVRVCRDQTQPTHMIVMLATAGACLATNTAIGFAICWPMAWVVLHNDR